MKSYTAEFFRFLGCTLHDEGHVLAIQLTPDLSDYFGKPTLRLVFQPAHLEKNTELVTHGSYLANRMYDLIQHTGAKVAVALPKRYETNEHLALHAINCTQTSHRSKETYFPEGYLVFRVTYASDEKTEDLVIVERNVAGHLQIKNELPYPADLLNEARADRFPFTNKQAQQIYEESLALVRNHAEQQAEGHQHKRARHFYDTLTRLSAFYRQMIEEVPALEKNRAVVIQQLQEEYDIKTADEVAKNQMQITITPISFCAVSIPFQREHYTLQTNGIRATVDVHQNLFSGEIVFPRCGACQHDMHQVGICEAGGHAVCQNCLLECHVCGKHVCRDCGIDVCFECGEYVCQECSRGCHLCGELYCARHLVGCLICREHECRQCSQPCEVCGKPVGKIHLTACQSSFKLACPTCMTVCSCCQKHVITSLMHTCAFCGQQMCADCTFRCAVCDQEFCLHHVSECELTKQMVCARHIKKCSQCGRQVSTTLLHACDVCRKPVCPECARQCHHCGLVFCQEHAEDLIPCPECGTLYCALCSSGQDECEVCRKKGLALHTSEP